MTKAKNLIILGDIKHKVPGSTIMEDILIPRFFRAIKEDVQIILCKGNHDDGIEEILPEGIKIYDSKGVKISKYGFFHGHGWPSKKLMQCDYLFMGHIQPSVEFVDKFRYRNRQQVWLKGSLNKTAIKKKYKISKIGKLNLIVAPAFNKLSGSFAINTGKDLRGPFVLNKIFDLNQAKAYLLDGTYLGNVGMLTKNYKKILLEPL